MWTVFQCGLYAGIVIIGILEWTHGKLDIGFLDFFIGTLAIRIVLLEKK
jgi:hypothetical protein